jgi:cytochrome c-type biogenesis protein
MEINFWIAFIAGLVSFFSPCVFSLIPIYLAYLSGSVLSSSEDPSSIKLRRKLFLHGLSFVMGFSTVFILLGLTASAIGGLIFDLKDWIARIGGILVILFGLHISGILTIPLLNYEVRLQTDGTKTAGFISSFSMGVFFSAGWSPCVGPALGAILVLAANEASIVNGFWMLVGYSLGMAIPFLMATLLIEYLNVFIKRFKKTAVFFEKGFGVFLILIGVILFLGIFERLAQFSTLLDFGL